MTELTFVKSFLSAVDSRPVRFSQDYVADPSSMKWPIPVGSTKAFTEAFSSVQSDAAPSVHTAAPTTILRLSAQED